MVEGEGRRKVALTVDVSEWESVPEVAGGIIMEGSDGVVRKVVGFVYEDLLPIKERDHFTDSFSLTPTADLDDKLWELHPKNTCYDTAFVDSIIAEDLFDEVCTRLDEGDIESQREVRRVLHYVSDKDLLDELRERLDVSKQEWLRDDS